jgi:hypothetical protein
MTIVLNPSLWYRRFVGYKNGDAEAHNALAALCSAYLAAHQDDLSTILGGPMTRITVVPSSRGRPFASQPLAGVLRRSVRYRDFLVEGLTYQPGGTIGRQEYKPAAYQVNIAAVRDQRVVLVEDLWVSGAKAVSAAGAVLEAGAHGVVILSMAREVRPDSDYCPQEYVDATGRPFDVDAWPR